MKNRGHILYICTINCSPSCIFEISKSFNELLLEIFGLIHNYIIVGDFNFPDINWNNGNSNSVNGKEFFNIVSSLGGSQLISQPTRGSSILDLL